MDTLNFVDEEGKEQGQWKIYHDNGQLDLEGSFVDGKHHGLFHYYDEEGRLECKGFYNHDVIVRWEEFYPNGKLKSFTNYDDEGLPKRRINYTEDGKDGGYWVECVNEFPKRSNHVV